MSVCVLCGTPWGPVNNVCTNEECRGFCTWGDVKGGLPDSWTVTEKGWIPKPPPGPEEERQQG